MTRFKELARIEAAIKNHNEDELRWALGYCKMRLSIAGLKHAVKTWKDLERRIAAALKVAAPSK